MLTDFDFEESWKTSMESSWGHNVTDLDYKHVIEKKSESYFDMSGWLSEYDSA